MAIRLHPFLHTAGLYAVILPLFIGWIFSLVAMLGPELNKSTQMSLLTMGVRNGAAQPNGESGAWFGTFGSCYKVNGGNLICTGSRTEPHYNATLDGLIAAGLPAIMAGVLPDHLQDTPAVQASALCFLIIGVGVWAFSVTSARLRRWMPLKHSQLLYSFGIVLVFSGFLLNLTAALAQRVQFSQASTLFNQIATVQTKVNTTPGFQKTALGGSFIMQWVSAAFVAFSLPISVIQFYLWPDEADYGWSSTGSKA